MLAAVEKIESEQRAIVLKSVIISLLIYAFTSGLVLLFFEAHFQPPSFNSDIPMLEAELIDTPTPPQLLEKKMAPVVTSKPEETVSQDLSKGKQDTTGLKSLAETQNQTVQSREAVILTRGPLVISSVTPQIPGYLKNQNLKTNVLIEFLVTADGNSSPSLIGSSGNEELDVIALKAAKSWIFKSALKDGKPISGKARLRINFEVD